MGGALTLVLMCIWPAAAHTELESSDPADGAMLAEAPAQVTLTFGEAVTEPAYVVVTAPDGTRVEDGDAAVLDETVRQPLDAVETAAQEGSWTLAYRVVSVDGHPVTGELTFGVQTQPGRKDVNSSTGTPAPGAGGSGAADSNAAHAGHEANHGEAAGWREYASWLQLPLAALALGGLYLWSSPRRLRDG